MLFSSQSATSLSFIALDAFDIIVSPGQNFLKPPPVPETPTEIFTSGFKIVNSSATAWVIGKTVEEPSINISPVSVSTAGSETSFVDSTVVWVTNSSLSVESSELVSLLSPHATTNKDRIKSNEVNFNLVIKLPF